MAGLLAAGLAVFWAGQGTAGCADAREEPCAIAEGTYHVVLPDPAFASPPALVFLHGWGSSGAGVLSNERLVRDVVGHGMALIAPDGTPREGDASGRTWSFHPDRPAARDEAAFLDAVAEDAARRHGLDRARMILGGFSIGGSMASYVACDAPETFRAYAPVAGSFWRPHPERCAGPVRLLHTHGWTDTVVPLEGRHVGGSALAQGNVFHAMEVWRATNGCDALRADGFEIADDAWRRRWERCDPGSALELTLFPGGHAVPQGWAGMMVDWFETLPTN